MAKQPRAVGYCRTSGEGQRDNTSIPRQREAIKDYCRQQHGGADDPTGWELIRFYVDESKSGSKFEGRDDFQQMMRDAAAAKFDVVVVYDITRFARNGADIIDKARFLKSTFGIHLIDTKGQFDNRKARNALVNHVHAGISEHERLSILERTIGGRIAVAREGRQWTGAKPFGRDFDKKTQAWHVTEKGHRMQKLLERYVEGEFLADLVKEFGFSMPSVVTRAVRDAQLSGPFHARFNAPEIEVIDLEVPVPGMPEVITPELEVRVRERMHHNRKFNKGKLRKYQLTGYVRCGVCGAALTSASCSKNQYYRHHQKTGTGGKSCGFTSIRADLLETHVLDYLYKFFTDMPAFEEAVRKAMPTIEDRNKIEKELKRTKPQYGKTERAIANLIKAIETGADASMFISRQEELRNERNSLAENIDELETELAEMPTLELVERRAMLMQIMLYEAHRGKDWRKLPFDEITKFLRFMFGDNTRKTGHSIHVTPHGDGWRITFSGRVVFGHELLNGYPSTAAYQRAVRNANKRVQTRLQTAIDKADREYEEAIGEVIKPDAPNSGARRDADQHGEHEWWLCDLVQHLDIPRSTLNNWQKRGWMIGRKLPGLRGRWIIWADEDELNRLRELRQTRSSWSDSPLPKLPDNPQTTNREQVYHKGRHCGHIFVYPNPVTLAIWLTSSRISLGLR